jgi:hypothetical protein
MDTHGFRPAAAAALIASGLLLAACNRSGSSAHVNAPDTVSGSRATSSSSTATSPAPAIARTPLATTSPARDASATSHVAAARVTACSLLTERDVTSVVGADLGKGSATERDEASQCLYGSYQNQVLLVNVIRSRGKADFAHARTDPHLIQIPGSRVADVSGLGDRAFELSAPHTDALYFTKGDALIIVAFSTRTAPLTGAALALAKIAASRL